MTVLTKTKKPHKRPRCEAKNAQGQRCAFQSIEYVGPWCFCKVHAQRAKAHAVNQFEVVRGGE
jgi:hypothetical protein